MMPGITIERPKMTRVMYQSLKRHIMRDRERKKQEQEHDRAMERERKERELRKKKEEEDSLTLEQTRDQISHLEGRLENLKSEKHELFSQLKKVLHQEDENRKRAQDKEHNEMMSIQQYSTVLHPVFLQQHLQSRGNKFLNVQVPVVPGMKRTRTPSPPPPPPPPPPAAPPSSSLYQHYTTSKYPSTTTFSSRIKPESYSSVAKSSSYLSTHVTYASQSGHSYQPPHLPQHTVSTTQNQAPPTQHTTTPAVQHQATPPHQQSTPTKHQVTPQSHQAPPTQHQALPTQHQAPPTQHQAPPTQHQAPPTQHQAPPSQHQAPPSQHQPSQPPHPSTQPPHPSTQHSGQSQSSKYPAGQSAFQTYSSHYGHQQKPMGERIGQGYTVQRLPQPAYIDGSHGSGSLTLQQQLEHANQKSGFSEEKFKMQQQQPNRGVAPLTQQQAIRGVAPLSQQQAIRGVAPLPQQQQAQMLSTAQPAIPPKGSIVTGYPIRTQASSNYPPSTQASLSPHAAGPRINYRGGQAQGRFY